MHDGQTDGRKVYETMSVWEKPDVLRHLNAAALEYVPIELVDERRFDHGLVYLQYRAKG